MQWTSGGPGGEAVSDRTIVVVLLVDTVDSTLMLSELGQDRMDEVVAAEMEALIAAVVDHGGHVSRTLGDGLLATFRAASTALDAAAAMHRSIARLNDGSTFGVDVRVRVTLAASDATLADDEIRGMAPVLTARLEDFAGAGETLCTDAVRTLAQGWGAHGFERLEPLQLRGIHEAVVVHRVTVPIADLLGLPETLEVGQRLGFVGRAHEWQILSRAWDSARTGGGSMVVLAGDPGIGKSRLCQEFAGHVRDAGAIVLHGTCTEFTGWAFEPFVEPVRHCLARVADVSEVVGTRPEDLARIVPEIRTRMPGLESAGGADAETARHFLFEAVTSWLVELTRHAPVLFVLDDVSWADDASITLLRHLLSRISGERVMFAMTYRPGDATTQARRFLQDERAAIRRVDVAGLDMEQALVFTEGVLGGTLDRGGRGVIVSAARSVGGNPLYLGEVVSHLTESMGLVHGAAGWTIGPGLEPRVVPPTLTDVITRRIDRLGQSAQRLLRVASVVGTAIDPLVLFELLDSNMVESAQALEDVTEAGFLRHVAGHDRYEFTHAVFRDVLYNSQSRAWRVTEHQGVGEVIERRYGADLDPWLDVLAYQFEQSAELYGPDRAIDYLRRAGRRAEMQRGNEHAVGFYRRALTLVDPTATEFGRLRCELMIELGDAERRSGQRSARRTMLEATTCAIDIGDARLATQAVLGSGRGIFSLAGSVDAERVAALREVLTLLGSEPTEQRARVLAALSAELIFDDDPTVARDASDEALSIARERGDPTTLVTTLGLRLVALWTPDQVQQRLQLGAELDEFRKLAGSRRSGQFLSAMTLYCQAAMEGGELALADQLLAWIEQTANELRQPASVGYAKLRLASRATVAGRLDEAEQLATEAYRLCLDAGQKDAEAFYTGQLFTIRLHQGRLGEVLDMLAESAERYPGIRAFRAATAVCAAEVDDLDRCRKEFQDVAAGLEQIRFDLNWLPAIALTAVAAARLGDSGVAARLRPMLEPYRHQFIDNASTFFGSVEHFYGLCCAVVGDDVAAEVAFDVALAAHRRLGSPPLLARTQLEYADTLALQGAPAKERVIELAMAALVEAERSGYSRIMARSSILLEQNRAPAR